MLSFIEVKRSCFCLESTSSCSAYPTAFCMQVIYARCRWNIYVRNAAKRSPSAGDGGSWNVFQRAKYLSILTWIWVKGWCKDCKKYAYYMSCFFICIYIWFFSEKHPPFVLPRALLRYLSWSRGAFASHRCSGKNCWIVSRWLKFEAKHRVRKPTTLNCHVPFEGTFARQERNIMLEAQ